MRLIDADALGNRMYHESFEKDSDLQKWDSGCWIRYKLFEQVLRAAPTIEPQKWVPVSERLPKQQQTVLIQDFGQITIGYLNAENRWRDLTNIDDCLKGSCMDATT